MLPESFGGRIIYLLQQYGPSFLKGAGVSMWLALVGTLFGCIIGFLVGIVQTIPVDKNDSTAKKVIIKVVKFIRKVSDSELQKITAYTKDKLL